MAIVAGLNIAKPSFNGFSEYYSDHGRGYVLDTSEGYPETLVEAKISDPYQSLTCPSEARIPDPARVSPDPARVSPDPHQGLTRL